MSSQDELEMGQVAGENISLAELAGIDLGGVEAARAFRFPIAECVWEVIATPEDGKPELKLGNSGKFMVTIPCKCLDVIHIKDKNEAPDGDPTKLIGKIHRETQFVSTLDSVKYIKGLIADIMQVSDKTLKGGLQANLDKMVGVRFQAPIKHRSNPNDKDAPPFVNLVQEKIKPEKRAAAA